LEEEKIREDCEIEEREDRDRQRVQVNVNKPEAAIEVERRREGKRGSLGRLRFDSEWFQ
jgi:hypothetical protein